MIRTILIQGPAATNVPERIYGVIDLYGQAAQAKKKDYKGWLILDSQATIIDLADLRSPDGLESTVGVKSDQQC